MRATSNDVALIVIVFLPSLSNELSIVPSPFNRMIPICEVESEDGEVLRQYYRDIPGLVTAICYQNESYFKSEIEQEISKQKENLDFQATIQNQLMKR